MQHRVIGIDLGTTYSAVAAFDLDEEQAEVIVDRSDADAATTPSVVAYDPMTEKVTVGWQAKRNLPNNPENTIIEIKREMGAVADSGDGREPDPLTVRFAGQDCLPQFISAFTLRKMKEIAEAEIGEEIRDAVITVPAWFPEPQRAATRQAALLAGLYPRQLVPEPTAAAICYGVDRDDPSRHHYLVYDLGGGTFDVSIIKTEREEIDVIATAGDKRLGGGDFDNAVTEWAGGGGPAWRGR
jgi:molecular chaperone DnaK